MGLLKKEGNIGICIPVNEKTIQSLPPEAQKLTKIGDTFCYDEYDNETWVLLERINTGKEKEPTFFFKAGSGSTDKQKQLINTFKRKII